MGQGILLIESPRANYNVEIPIILYPDDATSLL